jgi:hypothetical protein
MTRNYSAPAARWSGNRFRSPTDSAEKAHVTNPWALRDVQMLATWIAHVKAQQNKVTTYKSQYRRRFFSDTRRMSEDSIQGIHATGKPLSAGARATLEGFFRRANLPIPPEPEGQPPHVPWEAPDGQDKPLKPPARKPPASDDE